MKTKELIAQLLKADPNGEHDVTIGNAPIHFAERMPAYYDGTSQRMIQDEQGDVIGFEYAKSNEIKISLHPYSIDDALWDFPDLPINYDNLGPETAERYKKAHELTRQKSRELQ